MTNHITVNRLYKYRLYPASLKKDLWMPCSMPPEVFTTTRCNIGVNAGRKAATVWDSTNRPDCIRPGGRFPTENPLQQLNMSAGQQILRRLDIAYQAAMSCKRGFPRFKPHTRFNSVDLRVW